MAGQRRNYETSTVYAGPRGESNGRAANLRIGVEQAGAWRHALPDGLGSVLAAHGYGPFGEPPGPLSLPPWGYTGEWHDAAGVVYPRARWYSPALGRFVQVVHADVASLSDTASFAWPSAGVEIAGVGETFWPGAGRAAGYAGFAAP